MGDQLTRDRNKVGINLFNLDSPQHWRRSFALRMINGGQRYLILDAGFLLDVASLRSLLLEAKWRLALGLNVEAFFRNLQQRNQPLSATKYSKTIIFQYFYQD